MNDYLPSKDLLAAIRGFEGLRLVPYQDVAGFLTVGFGHKLLPGQPTTPITAEQAESYLLSDSMIAGNFVRVAAQIEMTQHQYDALTDFVYNLGSGRLMESTLLHRVRAGAWDDAQTEIMRWVHAGGAVMEGLVHRRQWECDRLDPNFGVPKNVDPEVE